MDILISILEWLLLKSIYGAVIFTAVTFGLATVLVAFLKKMVGGRLPAALAVVPIAAAVLMFVTFFLFAPSYERVKFENQILAQIEDNPALRVVRTSRWGALVEPYTLFSDCCIGFFDVATPDPTASLNFSDEPTSFRRIIARFEEEPQVYLHDVNCDERTLDVAAADDAGTFRIHEWGTRMSEADFALYCTSDWASEMRALREQTAEVNQK